MSLTRIECRNFQSLKHVDLDLGHFTVIVGPSGSGKSAVMRAFKALATNVRGNGAITRGQKAMAITGRTETHTITLERGERSASYKITGEGGSLTYTKLAGDVPEHVTQALRIDPVGEGGSVNFASQFDKPYLLDESGATVARVLGELTRVTTIFEAVRAANRIRANAASTLKTRKNDLEQVKTRLAAFQGLTDRVRLLEEADQLNGRRQDLEARIGRLDAAVRTLRIAERAIAKAAVPDVPAVEPLNQVLTRYLDLQGKLRGIAAKAERLRQVDSEMMSSGHVQMDLENELADKLREAGVCPTCGQAIH